MTTHAFMEMRTVAHHAAQVPSALGATHLDGDVHEAAALTWDLRLGALVGSEVHGVRAGLRLADLTWILVRDHEVVSEKPAAEHPLEQGLTWLRYQAREHSQLRIRDVQPAPVGYDLPAHAVAEGTPVPSGGQDHLATLDRWYATAAAVLEQVRRTHDHAAPVRCWPHHFDIATLISLDPGEKDAEKARSIGVGMTPGDAGIDEVYVYVTPWPYPAERTGPQLPAGGSWNVEGWFGATLRSSQLQGGNSGLVDFVEAAITSCRQILTR